MWSIPYGLPLENQAIFLFKANINRQTKQQKEHEKSNTTPARTRENKTKPLTNSTVPNQTASSIKKTPATK